MKRRRFIQSFPVFTALCSAGQSAWAVGEKNDGKDYGASATSQATVNSIGAYTLTDLLEFHRAELEHEYVALWDTGGIDWEYGGFIRRWDEHGNFTTDIKEMYNLGRGLWVFSYLYNHFGKRDRHLRAARLCKDFIFRYCQDSSGRWISKVTRDGRSVEGPYDIYGDMYVILGLTELWKATGNDSLLDVAVDTAHGINERIVSAGYQHIKAHKKGYIPGTKILGTWQHFLSVLTPLARKKKDHGIEMMARMCAHNILERHWREEYGVYLEYLDDKFEPFRPGYDNELRKVSSWHSVQSAWMCMDEALRLGKKDMFLHALETGRMTFEKCWLEGDDGGLIGLDYPEQRVENSSDSPSWGRLDDAMVFALLAIEHTLAPWAIEWFDRLYTHGYKRPERWNRTGLLHHPRRLFFCIQILERMIARNGMVSDFLA